MAKFGKSMLLLGAFLTTGTTAALAGETSLRATLAEPAQANRLVAHGLLWRCVEDQCTAQAGNSRPLIVCQALAKTAGPVSQFGSGATMLDTEQLARCNGTRSTERIAAAK